MSIHALAWIDLTSGDDPVIEKHYSPRELAELSGVRETTLAAWRCRSGKHPSAVARGPRFIKLGRCVRYPAAAVQSWLSQRGDAAAQPATSN
jgi:predicted DNA-binding transcriptional regulator AlpA